MSGVSVVIPVRDGSRYLPAALASVRDQTHPPLEVVVVDDGSADGSGNLAAAEGARVVRLAASGPAAARNAGVDAARGDAIAFLDADDLMTEDRLGVQRGVLDRHADCIAVAGRATEFLTPEREEELRTRFAASATPVHTWTAGTMLVRREAFLATGGFDADLTGGEVVDWVRRVRAAGPAALAAHDEVVLRRRIHGDNLTLRRGPLHAGYLAVAHAAIRARREERP